MQCCGTSTIAPFHIDGRRLEGVAEGLTLFGRCQLALDATVVSPLHGDATHRRRADVEDGVALREARRRKERTYPELCQGNGRARLVVIAEKSGAGGLMRPRRSCGGLRQGDVSAATDVWQCPSWLVLEVDMPLGLLFGEGGGLLPSGQEGFSWSRRSGAVSQRCGG